MISVRTVLAGTFGVAVLGLLGTYSMETSDKANHHFTQSADRMTTVAMYADDFDIADLVPDNGPKWTETNLVSGKNQISTAMYTKIGSRTLKEFSLSVFDGPDTNTTQVQCTYSCPAGTYSTPGTPPTPTCTYEGCTLIAHQNSHCPSSLPVLQNPPPVGHTDCPAGNETITYTY